MLEVPLRFLARAEEMSRDRAITAQEEGILWCGFQSTNSPSHVAPVKNNEERLDVCSKLHKRYSLPRPNNF
jgi:hypothetical protein